MGSRKFFPVAGGSRLKLPRNFTALGEIGAQREDRGSKKEDRGRDREGTGRGPGGDREETGRGPGGDQEGTGPPPLFFLSKEEGRVGEREGGEGGEIREDEQAERAGWWTWKLSGREYELSLIHI